MCSDDQQDQADKTKDVSADYESDKHRTQATVIS